MFLEKKCSENSIPLATLLFSKPSESLCSCSFEIEDTSHYIMDCHHFSHHRVDLMNSVKSVCDNFESMPDNVQKDYSVTHGLMKTKIKLFWKQQ